MFESILAHIRNAAKSVASAVRLLQEFLRILTAFQSALATV